MLEMSQIERINLFAAAKSRGLGVQSIVNAQQNAFGRRLRNEPTIIRHGNLRRLHQDPNWTEVDFILPLESKALSAQINPPLPPS
jgi:hypothetical protein